MNSQQPSSVSDSDVRDTDIVPEDSPVSWQTPSGLTPHDMADGYHYPTIPTTSNVHRTSVAPVASRQAYSQSDGQRHATPAKQSPGFLKRVTGIFSPSTGSFPANSEAEQQLYAKEEEIECLREALRRKDSTVKSISKDHKKDVERQQQQFQNALDDKIRGYEAREMDLERCNAQIHYDYDESMREFQAKVCEIESHRNMIQEKYDIVIRKQQEESFKQMESGRWLPSEESKVIGDLDRIRRDMRTWAKGTSIKDMSPFQKLDGVEFAALMKGLSCVVLLQNNQLPQGLSAPKSPSLLLNALLAHDVYTTVFRNPFFFLNDGLGHELPRAGLEDTLDEIYRLAQDSNQQDAHIWRSQMLRLFLPPLRTDSKDGEKTLHSWTEGMIAKASKRQASHFAAGSARHLVSTDAKTDYTKRLNAIYQEAATLSYRLWTRRTTMRCSTLHEMGNPTFNIDSPNQVPHTLVRYDDHEDQLVHKPITVIVHPLLQVYGTDEAKDYDKGRVWAPAEVWLDSR